MMKRKALQTAILILCSFSLSACWDSVELERRGFVISIGLDRFDGAAGDENTENRYTVTLSLPNLETIVDGGDSRQTLKITEDKTVSAAIRQVDSYSNQKLYFGQTRAAIFGEELLEDTGLFREALDALERNRDLSAKMIVLSAEGKAADILACETEEAPVAGLFISNFYSNKNQSAAQTFKLDLENFLRRLRADGSGILPKITVENDAIRLGGAAVIKDYQLAGWLTEGEVRGYLWLRGGGTNAELTAEYNGTHIPLKITEQNAGFQLYEQDGRVICAAVIQTEACIDEYKTDASSLFSEAALVAIQADCEAIIKDELIATNTIFREVYDVDGFELKEYMRKFHYDLYLKYQNDWPALFEKFELVPTVSVVIRNTGQMK